MKKKVFLPVALLFLSALPLTVEPQPRREAPPSAARAAAPAAVPAGRRVQVLVLDGTVNPISARYLEAGIQRAAEEGAPAVVIEVNTPGGLASAMDRIVEAMLASPVPVIVYVYPPGARAASAGLFIAMAAQVLAMAPGTNIGAAHPVSSGGADIQGVEGEKILNDAAARVRSLAGLRGRNAAWAESAVRSSVSLSADEAVREKVADLSAGSLEELLAAVDGREVKVPAGTVTLRTAGLPAEAAGMGPIDRLLDFLVNPSLAYILFLLGLFGVMIELATPGFGVPGTVGGISLLVALIAFGLLPTNLAGILVLIFGAVLFVVDIKAPTHGILTAGGIIALLLGAFLLFPPWRPSSLPGGPSLRIPTVTIVAATALMSAAFLAIAAFGLRAQRRRVTSGAEALIGAAGVALTDLRPTGIVRVQGEEWNAFSPGGEIRKGEEIEVLAIRGLQAVVGRRVRPMPLSTEA